MNRYIHKCTVPVTVKHWKFDIIQIATLSICSPFAQTLSLDDVFVQRGHNWTKPSMNKPVLLAYVIQEWFGYGSHSKLSIKGKKEEEVQINQQSLFPCHSVLSSGEHWWEWNWRSLAWHGWCLKRRQRSLGLRNCDNASGEADDEQQQAPGTPT